MRRLSLSVEGDVFYESATVGGRNMVIVLQKGIPEKEKQDLKSFLIRNNFKVNEIAGEEDTIFGAVGKLSIDPREVEILPGVERVIPISKPYKIVEVSFGHPCFVKSLHLPNPHRLAGRFLSSDE